MKAMLFAAGMGTRLKPWTDIHPKALAVVNGKTLLQRNIEYLQLAGIKEVVVNVHHFADQIIQAVSESKGWGSLVHISDETGQLLDTGGGLVKAAPYFLGESYFVAMNVDILTDLSLEKMIQQHLDLNALATLAVSDRMSNRHFLFDEAQSLVGWRQLEPFSEKIVKDSQLLIPKAFSGVHVISPAIFDKIQLQGKFSMVDIYLSLASHCKIVGYNHTGTRFLDVGKPASLQLANETFH
ncbi:MAG: nucleotidyltransferase family protein [Chitinophagia bacterium]|jgi:NDP-sugar pyrophosphorylase family protein